MFTLVTLPANPDVNLTSAPCVAKPSPSLLEASSHRSLLSTPEPRCPAWPPRYHLPRDARTFLPVYRCGKRQRAHFALLLRERGASGHRDRDHQDRRATDTWHWDRYEGNIHPRRCFWIQRSTEIFEMITQWLLVTSCTSNPCKVKSCEPWESSQFGLGMHYTGKISPCNRFFFLIIRCLRQEEIQLLSVNTGELGKGNGGWLTELQSARYQIVDSEKERAY